MTRVIAHGDSHTDDYKWIPNDDELLAMGAHGQIVLVSRASRTVIVRLGRDRHDGSRGLGFDDHGETNVSIARRFERVTARLHKSTLAR